MPLLQSRLQTSLIASNWKIVLEVISFIQRFEAVVILFYLKKDFFLCLLNICIRLFSSMNQGG